MYKYEHRTRGHPLQRLLSFVFVLVMLITMVPADLAKADPIEHTHIWATKYDDKNHWEYCTVCKAIKNKEAHTFTDHWAFGYESCKNNNYSKRICNCGYSYIYHKPHSEIHIAESHTYWERVHVNKCSSCGSWLSTSECYNENGAINCKNPGKCLICGGSWPTGRHDIKNGICSTCGTTFYKMSEPQVSYNDDFTHVYIKYIFYPANSSVIPIDTQTNASPYTNGGMSHHGNITKNSDGTYTINLDVIISSSREKVSVGWIYNNVAVNDVKCFVHTTPITVWQDHQAPTQNDIIQKDQTSANGWATIKQLTLSGTENLSDIVYLTISDKVTGEKYVTNAAVPVTDGKYSYNCTPSIEGDANGRTYVVTAKDRIGNTSTKEFIVSKTDGSYPQLKNGTSLTYTDWSTSKNISLSFFDFGSSDIEASFDNQTDYKPLTKNGEYYVWNHLFGDQVGTSEHTIYVRDALGNTGSYKLTVGNTDSNVYSITYNLNGGSLSGQRTGYTVADSFILPTPTKTGYTFTGWTGTRLSSCTKSVTISKGSSGNRSYTAKWVPNTLTVRYHNDGAQTYLDPDKNTLIDVTGKDIIRAMSVSYDEDYDSINGLLNVSRLTKTGYHSNGYWFVGSKNSSIKLSDSKGYPKAQDVAQDAGVLNAFQKGNVTIGLYPDMSPNTYTLTFNYGKKSATTAKSKTITYDSIYGTLPNPQCTGWIFKGWNTKADGSGNVVTEKTICKNLSNVTIYAQWSYNPVSVKVPQVLTGDHTGKSQFRVKCDDFKAGNIKITVPNSFLYKQAGKADVTAAITSKSGNNTITPSNKVCVYNITTKNGLSAGCWSGSFNIGLTLTKE